MDIGSAIWNGVTIPWVRLYQHGAAVTWLWLYEKIARLWQGVSPAATSEVVERVFVGGQHYRHGLAVMRQMGIGATLSLRGEVDDQARGVAFPRHLWLPTPDNGAPTVEQMQKGVEFIRDALAAGQGVYLHCGQGVGRAPTLAAAYLITQGQTAEAALDTIRKVRPFITPTRAQWQRLEEWARRQR